ncbi:hypothetical protein B0H14DRAFT_782230 [Mycena olivaceomarginata]|nr:hypothetical protein B0H14DRAFT_782230 [Mycena olivaceomarginata]
MYPHPNSRLLGLRQQLQSTDPYLVISENTENSSVVGEHDFCADSSAFDCSTQAQLISSCRLTGSPAHFLIALTSANGVSLCWSTASAFRNARTLVERCDKIVACREQPATSVSTSQVLSVILADWGHGHWLNHRPPAQYKYRDVGGLFHPIDLTMAHPNFLLNSRTLIIGGSSGIGYAVASGALANGSKVHITSVTAQKLSAKITQLRSLYPNAHVSGSTADLSSTETLEGNLQSALDAAVKETGGALDHIVYTAGELPERTSLAQTTAVTALAPFTVRYLGPLLIGKLIAASLTKQIGTPEAAAEAYLFCMRSALATGQDFKVENGFLMA